MTQTTRLAPQRRPGLQTFRGALQRLTMTLMLVMLTTIGVWASPSDNWSSNKASSFSVIDESAKTISITSGAELALLAYNTRNNSQYYSGYTITLTCDLDMSAHNWDGPIGKSNDGFQGTFDGAGHTISGITLRKVSGYSYQGLFGYLNGGTIKNLTLENSTITAQSYVGGIVGYNYGGTIQNCHVLATVSVLNEESSANYHGGIAGRNTGTITGCTSAATVIDGNNTSCEGYGGIVGLLDDPGTVTNCHYYGNSVSGYSGRFGAIVGKILDNGVAVSNCYYTISGIGGIGNSYIGKYTPTVTNVSYGNQLTLGENITTSTAATTFTVPTHDELNSGGTAFEAVAARTYSFYVTGQTITLGYSGSGDVVYAVNGESIEGNTFTMPDGGATVSLYTDAGTAPTISGLTYNSTYGYYGISDAAALNALANYVNSGNNASGLRFKQTADIDMNSVNYTPIGKDANNTFNGTYDGSGYVILNISLNATSMSGLFGELKGTVKNVNLKDCSFSGTNAGGIAGYMNGGTIDNCTVIGGTVSCGNNDYSGGIVGYFYAGTVKDCFAANTVSAYSANSGQNGPVVGIVGSSAGYTDNNYYTTAVSDGNSTGTQVSGGFITAGEGVTIGSGVWRTIGKTAANTYYFGKQDDVITFTAEVPTSTMKKFATTAGTLAGTVTAGTVTLTMPAEAVTVSLASVMPTITVAETIYTGSALTPSITVKDGDTTLEADTHYTVGEYSNNINAGTNTATVTITGKGIYLGTASQTFTISPASVTLTANSGTELYDGTEKTITGFTCSVDGLTFTGVSASGSGTDAGEYDVTFSGVTINTTTDDTGNYVVTGTTNGKLTIMPISGNCGTTGSESSVTWSYDVNTKALTISGTGAMMYYGLTNDYLHSTAPWSAYDSEIETVVVEDGVTSVGAYAFARCSQLTSVSLPASVFQIDQAAFYNSNVIRVDIPSTAIVTLGANAFDYTPTALQIAVPANLLKTYQEATNWSTYATKLEGVLSETTGFATTFATGNYEYSRTFKCGTAATLCLPFELSSAQISPFGKVYRFDGVDKETEPKWTVVMREEDPSNLVTGNLAANTPYLFVPYILDGKSKGDAMPITFTGKVTTAENAGYASKAEGTDGAYWTFQGVYYSLAWNDGDANLGKIYGFAAQSYDGGSYTVSPGDFVKAMAGASIKPFRAFLQYTSAPLSASRRVGADELPSSMTVRLINANGEVTTIGNLDTRTGEIDFDSDAWYSLDGHKLEAKPTQKGLYIYKGKKVVIK